LPHGAVFRPKLAITSWTTRFGELDDYLIGGYSNRIVHPIRAAIGLLSVCAMLAHTGGVAASGPTPDPTAAYQFNLLGNSDTAISLPVVRAKVASSIVASFFGNLITAGGSPAWSTDQFVYSPGIQTNTYFVYFRSGLK